ncbi:MAG TPA: hypothetical protein VEK08_09655 [Planctomycetota bacterium]|nr:hypothetical protein [Planctomycetota bacterium]
MTRSERIIGENLRRFRSGRVRSVQQQGLAQLAEYKLELEKTAFITRIVNARSCAYIFYECDAPEELPRGKDFVVRDYRPLVPKDTYVLAAGLNEKELYELINVVCSGVQRGAEFRAAHGFEDGPHAREFRKATL